MDTIEYHDIGMSQWELIRIWLFTKRSIPCVSVASPTQILLAGGYNGSEYLREMVLFDVNRRTATRLPDAPVELWGKDCGCQEKDGVVILPIYRAEPREYRLVRYTLATNEFDAFSH